MAEATDGTEGAPGAETEADLVAALPPQNRPRASIVSSQYWTWIQLLEDNDPRRLRLGTTKRNRNNHTHFCTFCDATICCRWTAPNQGRGGSYKSQDASRHIEKCDDALENNVVTALLKKKEAKEESVQKRELVKAEGLKEVEAINLMQASKKIKVDLTQTTFKTLASPTDVAIGAVARWIMYSPSCPPMSVLNEPEYIDILTAYKNLGDPERKIKTPTMNRAQYIRHVNTEDAWVKKCIAEMIVKKHIKCKGNPFMQYIHDATTLDNSQKYLAIGAQFVPDDWSRNIVVALAFVPTKSTTGDACKILIENAFKACTSLEFDKVCGSGVQDKAALKTAQLLGLEKESCDMHDGDKIGKSAIGELVRSRNRIPVNPFNEGKDLVKKFQDQAKHFHSTPANQMKLDNLLDRNKDLPNAKIQRDLNETRISARWNLLCSSLRMKKPMRLYEVEHGIAFLSEQDWKAGLDFEAVLNCSRKLCTLSQCENYFVASFGAVVRMDCHRTLTSEKIMVADLDNWQKDKPRPPRVEKNVADMTALGKISRLRAIIECERQFFGSTQNLPLEPGISKLKITRREQAVQFLDPRTCMNATIGYSKEDWTLFITALEDFYVQFFKQCKMFDRTAANGGTQSNIEQVQLPAGDYLAEPTRRKQLYCLSDSEDEDQESDGTMSSTGVPLTGRAVVIAQEDLDEANAKEEFKKVHKAWAKYFNPVYAGHLNWKALYPKLPGDARPDLEDHMETYMKLDMKPLMLHLERVNKEKRNIFGYLPLMCKSSPVQLGTLNAQSHAERMNSSGNLMVTKHRLRLSDDIVNKMVCIKINKPFRDHLLKTVYYKRVLSIPGIEKVQDNDKE